MKFKYSAQTKKGEIKEGIIEAFDSKEAKKLLLEKDLIVFSLDPLKKKKKKEIKIPFFGKVSFFDKLLFVKHLRMMIKAGVPLRESVLEIQNETNSRKFKAILKKIVDDLDNGESLSRSLSRYPDVFDDLFVNLIKTGESSGTLEESLEYLGIQLEKSQDLKKKITSAMLYPALILIATFALIGLLAFFIFPKLLPLFEGFNIDLPLPTRILLWFIKTMQAFGFIIFVLVLLGLGFLFFISKFRAVKFLNHRLVLSLPLIGKFNRNINLAYLARTLGTLVKSGVPIVEALNITAKTLNNLVYRKYLKESVTKVQKGQEISKFLKGNPKLFPPVFSRMISTGEKTGRLDESLFYLAEFYEKEIDNATKNLSQILEPMLLIVVGLVVGFIAISIIMPIYKIAHSLSGLRK